MSTWLVTCKTTGFSSPVSDGTHFVRPTCSVWWIKSAMLIVNNRRSDNRKGTEHPSFSKWTTWLCVSITAPRLRNTELDMRNGVFVSTRAMRNHTEPTGINMAFWLVMVLLLPKRNVIETFCSLTLLRTSSGSSAKNFPAWWWPITDCDAPKSTIPQQPWLAKRTGSCFSPTCSITSGLLSDVGDCGMLSRVISTGLGLSSSTRWFLFILRGVFTRVCNEPALWFCVGSPRFPSFLAILLRRHNIRSGPCRSLVLCPMLSPMCDFFCPHSTVLTKHTFSTCFEKHTFCFCRLSCTPSMGKSSMMSDVSSTSFSAMTVMALAVVVRLFDPLAVAGAFGHSHFQCPFWRHFLQWDSAILKANGFLLKRPFDFPPPP